jgi:hypothetical protein
MKPGVVGRRSSSYQRPGPIGTELRLPTLEVFAALHGDLLSGEARRLTRHELELARPIFGAALAYDSVRVVVASFANAPTTLGNVIRISPEYQVTGIPDSTLIHELTHVWQFQTRGMRYMSNSLCQQMQAIITRGNRNFAYDLSGEDVVRAGSIDRLPAEKQAMLVELWYLEASLSFPGAPAPAPLRDNPVCQSMLAEVQSARPLSLGQIIDEAAFGPGNPRLMPSPGDAEGQLMPLLRFEF